MKGAVDLKSVQLLGNAYKEKVGVYQSFVYCLDDLLTYISFSWYSSMLLNVTKTEGFLFIKKYVNLKSAE